MSSITSAAKAGMAKLADMMDFRRRLDGYVVVFQKIAQIISGRADVRVRVVDPTGAAQVGLEKAPGWTDGDTIYFNQIVMERDLNLKGNDALRSIMALKGVMLHELGHIVISPRVQDDICQRIIQRQAKERDYRWWHSFNILEDQRMETWFVSKYGSSKRLFESSTYQWILSNPATLAESYVLIHGRKFIAPRIRVRARKAFIKKYGRDMADAFANVIDQYLLVSYPVGTNKAFQLVQQFKLLLNAIAQVQNDGHAADPGNINDPDRIDVRRKGRPQKQGRKDQERVRGVIEQAQEDDELEEAEQDAEEAASQLPPVVTTPDTDNDDADDDAEDAQQGEDDEDEGDGPEGQPGPSGKPGKASGDDEDDDWRNGGIDEHWTPVDENGEADADDDGPVGSDPGNGQGGNGCNTAGQDINKAQPQFDPAEKLLEDLEKELDELLNNQDILDDAQGIQKAIQAAQQNAGGQVQGKDGRFQNKPVPGTVHGIMRRTIAILREIKMDLEPDWQRRQIAGRLDPKRFMARQPHELDVFTQWNEGHEDEGGVEAVILLDMSHSMDNVMDQASQALWAIKRAFDDLDIKTTVLGYSESHIVLMRAQDKVPVGEYHAYPYYTSTNPETALKEALHVLSRTNEPNRLLLTITDGQWDVPGGVSDTEIEPILRSIKNLGTTTMILGLKRAVATYGRHHHQFGKDIQSITQLPEVATMLVAEIINRASARG